MRWRWAEERSEEAAGEENAPRGGLVQLHVDLGVDEDATCIGSECMRKCELNERDCISQTLSKLL
eukprot:334868-Pleurochrysis_carterae.AAC.1